ncbi:MAG TPA: hypothetical protein VHA33_13280 [Candidatus Angelobacter sp.]|jgi:hypothetical protein|nr:hypothetical protein [Candidatus Angelobacter sp.]
MASVAAGTTSLIAPTATVIGQHAEVYISRWFESVCSPPKPSFK